MLLKPTDKTTDETAIDNRDREVVLKNIPIYENEKGEEVITLANMMEAEEESIARENNINTRNIYELALLYADVLQRRDAIRQKFRFNKMLFYVKKELEELYGENIYNVDEMGTARAGPIPIHLADDIKDLQKRDIIKIYIVKDGKKISGSKKKWEKIKHKGSIECKLTQKGEKLAKNIWSEIDSELREKILNVKKKIFYLDTQQLKEKVHQEYPEYKKNYVENDTETFEEFLVSV